MENKSSIELAKQLFASRKYQDVVVIKTDGNSAPPFIIQCNCVWRNGERCNYQVKTKDCYLFDG